MAAGFGPGNIRRARSLGCVRLDAVARPADAASDRAAPGPEDGFGAVLRRRRIVARLTQEQLASRAGLSARSLGDIERGRVRNPRTDTVQLLGQALGLTGAELDRFETLARADYWAGRDSTPPEPRPAEPGPPRPAQLPADVSAFTGRHAHLQQLDAVLASTTSPAAVVISAITGTAGVGKTALAIHWAHHVRHHFPDGQLYLNLRGYDPGPPLRPIDALARILHALGIPAEQVPIDQEEAASLYRSLLADKHMLILLDNAGHPDQIRPLLPGSPTSLVLTTSRDQLAGLIARDGAHQLTINPLTPTEAHTLLTHILGTRTTTEPEATTQLAQLCAHLPLALRIAAANLTNRPQDTIAGFVDQLRAGDRLTALAVTGDEQAGVRAAFDLSYAALPTPAQRMFRLLALVPGPEVTAPAAAAVAGTTVGHAREILHRLAAVHLIAEPAPARYALHDLLFRYAGERGRHEDSGADRDTASGRLLGWYLATATTAAQLLYPQMLRLDPPATPPGLPPPGFTDHPGALAWLSTERANLLAAIQHAATNGPHPIAWHLADILRGYFWHSRYTVDWLTGARAGLAAAVAAADVRAQTALQLSIGMAYHCMQRYELAIERYTAVAELAEQDGWVDAQAASAGNLGLVHAELGNLRRSAECHTEALLLTRQTGRLGGQATALANLGWAYGELGQFQQANEHLTEALALYEQIGSPAGEAHALDNLGAVQRGLGRLAAARADLTRALALYQQVGNRYGEAETLLDLAAVHVDARRHTQALDLARRSLAIARDTGERRIEAEVLNLLAAIQLDLGRAQQALDYQQQALRLARAAGAHYLETDALIGLAAAHRDRHQRLRATACATEALALAQQSGYRVLEGNAHAVLATIHRAAGHHAEAADHARQALMVHRETGHRLGQARAHVVLGQTLAHTRRTETAVEHWQRALDLFTDIGSLEADDVRALLGSRAIPAGQPAPQSRPALESQPALDGQPVPGGRPAPVGGAVPRPRPAPAGRPVPDDCPLPGSPQA
jgi:tetratricopeptide (TPR) repeat protein/transcriptional regulator with XRE-family HTH domain